MGWMARRPRLFAPGILYHVIVRGIYKQKTLFNGRDYEAYGELVDLAVFGAYCGRRRLEKAKRPDSQRLTKIESLAPADMDEAQCGGINPWLRITNEDLNCSQRDDRIAGF
jgi:hypothetical protein